MANAVEIMWAKEILGLEESISLKNLRERYISLAKRFHPDIAGPIEGTDDPPTLAEITHAYHLMVSYLENVSIPLADDDVRKNDPHAYHLYRFHDWLGDKS